ncbi:hypothetical protein HanIR_Chr06g0283051 [Helianthus annuus]|nr:hypothetical protein HanIR_Chr06g0283051 [Helianthus annuus]
MCPPALSPAIKHREIFAFSGNHFDLFTSASRNFSTSSPSSCCEGCRCSGARR